MARDINEVVLMGNLTDDPEVKTSPDRTKTVAKFRLCTSRTFMQDGEQTTKKQFHNITTFGRTAEICHDYLHKGSRVYVKGTLEYSSWDDKKTGEKRYRTEIILIPHEGLNMLDGGPKSQDDTGDDEPQN